MDENFIDRRAGDKQKPKTNWVEDRLAPIEEHIVQLQAEIYVMQEEVDKIKESMPNGSIPEHKTMHQLYLEDKKVRDEKEKANEKLKLEIRNNFIKTAVQAVLVALFGILMLGLNSQFNTMVRQVVDTPSAVVAPK